MDDAWVDEGAPERAVISGMTLTVVWMAVQPCSGSTESVGRMRWVFDFYCCYWVILSGSILRMYWFSERVVVDSYAFSSQGFFTPVVRHIHALILFSSVCVSPLISSCALLDTAEFFSTFWIRRWS